MNNQRFNPVTKSRPSIIILPSLILLALSVFLFLAPNGSELRTPTSITPEPDRFLEADTSLENALQRVMRNQEGTWHLYDWLIERTIFDSTGNQALLWLAPLDPESGEVIATEPRRALATRLFITSDWQIILEDDPEFLNALNASALIESDFVIQSGPPSETKAERGTTVYGGYYLPWQASLTKRLTWSIGHTSCYPVELCTYAFDFADGSMFPLMAAKPGYVYHWKDTCINGATDCTNSITLEDRSTTPWTYQIYLHLAQNSIPASLKLVGTPVLQGQRIANVDDTGASSGHHVHFMVVTKNTLYKSSYGYYFGWSVDITFRDVPINWDPTTKGGRPRLPNEATDYGGEGQYSYLSGNIFTKLPFKFFIPLIFR